ncbi:serine/threonine-protein kinase PknG [Actinoallomurus purpureus]|nr:serine/threonine-protein kinase [Actinoallomurus purpureus]MCO6010694.1 serine/threonine-protein kinase PknG [Actinoallomurus purpureus]
MAPTAAASANDQCAQPGCAGTVQDGYCDVCGTAAAPAPAASAASGAPASASVPAPSAALDDRCAEPGCGGTVVDGYCDTCGTAPVAPAAAPAGSRASARSAPVSAASRGTGVTGSTSSRSVRTGSSRSSSRRRGMLGAGLVEVPRVPYRDPASAVLSNPMVAENKRFCSGCGEPVGRSRGDRPGRTEGFCPKCGAGFSFTPKLKAGDVVGGQYEVLGCIAHGGLGWIYLARDENVSHRWVVLKGLLDTGDADALAAATAERAFLAEVEHPNIVKIYNFVQHDGSGYIVMEYVGGRPLKDILKERREEEGPDAGLPLPQVIAYGIEVLRAFDYLHGLGVLYCDFKPDNAIQSEEQLKLIDLGGVRRVDDVDGAIYGTVGYQAPEIADVGPSVGSDLYTVGRTLAVLSFPFKGYTGKWETSLPPREEVPVLARHESYDRLLRRATHADPGFRFQDSSDMADQLTGVLREVLAAEDGKPRPAASTLFGPERFTAGDVFDALSPAVAAATLPAPLVDSADPAAGFLAGLTALEPERLADALAGAHARTPEVDLTLARVRIELGDPAGAQAVLDALPQEDWRVGWYRAVAVLAAGHVTEAAALFDELYTLMPGEAAPKLGLAYCRELLGDPAGAADLHQAVWRTDRAFVTACYGLARARLAMGDRAGALRTLDSVPKISSHHIAAQISAVATAVRDRDPAEITEADLTDAGARLAGLSLDPGRHGLLALEVLEAALDWVRATGGGRGTVLGTSLTEHGLRRKLEETYRALARLATTRVERHSLVDQANAVRPVTVV